MTESKQDQWAQWLLHRRFGGDPKQMQDMAVLYAMRDEVLNHAKLGEDEVLLDIGCGDGLIAFGALDLVGPEGEVIFSDVSEDLLDECRSRAPHAEEARARREALRRSRGRGAQGTGARNPRRDRRHRL